MISHSLTNLDNFKKDNFVLNYHILEFDIQSNEIYFKDNFIE